MTEKRRYSEHYRIEQFLRKKTLKLSKAKTAKRHPNQLSNFPIGLIIISKEEKKSEYKLEFINQYACRLFQLKENVDINILNQKFDEYVKLKSNYSTKTSQKLSDIIFNTTSFNLEMDNFIPFESTHSKTSVLYLKINDIEDDKYIVIDKYDKYIEERKYIELNLIKTINYQYLHTLYHELNNPLNALLALSGEKDKFEQTELGGSRIYNKNYCMTKKSKNNKIKNEKRGLLTINSSKNLFFNQDDNRSKKRSYGEQNYEENNRIALLINIIKVFIKNFILYLKTRADNLLLLKNEYELQNDASDIMNAVEVSDYEKELTKHKFVKINLEYILELYLKKYLCLFQYKEIEHDTNFEKLRNIYVVTDEFNFSYYIRQIYTYLYYVVPKKEGFFFDYIEEDNNLKIMIKKKTYENLSRRTDLNQRIGIKDDGYIFNMDQAIQTKEMTKEVLYAMSKQLQFTIEIFDCDNLDQNNYLFITIPIEKNEESEYDDFKDEDINEMVGKDAIFLEEKLKRQFPNNSFFDVPRASNFSTIQMMDILNKSGEDMKMSNESFVSNNKSNIHNYNYKTMNKNLSRYSQKNSDKNINFFDSQNRLSSSKFNVSNGSHLSKYIKVSERKKLESSKFKTSNFLDLDTLPNKKKDKEKFGSYSSIKLSNKNIRIENVDKSENEEIKSHNSHKSNGIFTLINNKGQSEKIDNLDKPFSETSDNDSIKNKKEEMTFKEQSALLSGFGSSIIKGKVLNDNKIINNQINKKKPSCFVPEVNGGEKEDKDETLEKNGFVLIDLENERKKTNLQKRMNQNISNKLCLHTIREENEKKTLSSQNISSSVANNKNRMSNKELNENLQKETISKTEIDNEINDNETLFLKAIKESNFHKEKLKQKKNKNIKVSQSSEISQEDSDEENYEVENEEDGDNSLQSEEQCNCTDLLVVDDEEFNVMASQKMLLKLGYESDSAYNGEECINLINKKIKLNCKCKRSFYKIIFLDIVMPVMDGIKTAKQIQKMIDEKTLGEETKIVFISGNIDDINLRNSLLEIKCVKECLKKPVQISKYQKIIEKYYNQ